MKRQLFILAKHDHDDSENIDSTSDVETDSNTQDCDYQELRDPADNVHSSQEQFAQLFRAAVIIRAAISNSPSVSIWPLSAENLSIHECEKVVPVLLFNFLAWSCGVSEEFSIKKLQVDNDNQKKIFSLAQDVIYFASQGRKLMSKHLALGMTLRHLTGSSKLQQLINSFGHCVSHSATLEHDTALATKQLQRDSDVPSGFRRGVFTTLVWDNNDFGEETLTGMHHNFFLIKILKHLMTFNINLNLNL